MVSMKIVDFTFLFDFDPQHRPILHRFATIHNAADRRQTGMQSDRNSRSAIYWRFAYKTRQIAGMSPQICVANFQSTYKQCELNTTLQMCYVQLLWLHNDFHFGVHLSYLSVLAVTYNAHVSAPGHFFQVGAWQVESSTAYIARNPG